MIFAASLIVASAAAASEDCAAEEAAHGSNQGVFFSDSEFPGTGRFANEHSSPADLRANVKKWRTAYDSKAGPLTAEQHRTFFDDGFLLLPSLLPSNVLDGAVTSVEKLVDDLAQRLHAAGLVSSTHADAGFQDRLTRLEREYSHANVLLHKNGVLPEGIQSVWSHELLMGIAQQLLGPDAAIAGHPVWNLRCKTPEALSQGQATVPWHQDNAYLAEESWDVLQLTAWIPLVDTNTTNGCMQVVRGAHRPGGTAIHACCVGETWYVETTPEELATTLDVDMEKVAVVSTPRPFLRLLRNCHCRLSHTLCSSRLDFSRQDVVTCPVPFGGVLLLNNLIPHRSLPNLSDGIRWSLDLRWQRADQPNGFHGLKASVLMKDAGQRYNGRVDWGDWARQDRAQLTAAAHARDGPDAAGDGRDREPARPHGDGTNLVAFDTTIAGPWMKTWPLVHANRHTAKLVG